MKMRFVVAVSLIMGCSNEGVENQPARGSGAVEATGGGSIGGGASAGGSFSPASSSALLSFGTGQLDLVRLPSGQARTLSLDASEPRYLPDARHVLFAEKQTDLIFDRTEVPARQVIATGATIDSLMANRANDTVAFRLRGSNDVLMALRVKDGAHVVVDDFDGAALWLDASTLLYVKGQEIYTRSITWR